METSAPYAASLSQLDIPCGHVGPVVLPGSNRTVWWTGRVAIGLRYEQCRTGNLSRSAEWLQTSLLGAGPRAAEI